MPDDIDRKLVDKRVAQRYLRKGRLDEKDYERHLKSLPDLADRAVPIESNLESEAVDDDLEDTGATPDAGEAPQGG